MPTTTPFNNLITFSRGSNATLTGPNGLIQWAPNNLLTFSEQFDNAAAWPKTNATVTANAAIAPDGSSTADLMYPTTTGTNRRILRSTTLTVGTAYAQSVYVKAAGKQWVYLNGIDASGPDNNCWFDLQNGVVGTKGGSVLSAGISAVGGGWYRIFTVALAGANNYFYLMGVDGDNTITSTTNGTDGILIWGAQLELGSTATTYNPTTVKNLLGFSEAFDNAAWTKVAASIVTGAQANPVNGLFSAQKFMEDTTNAQHIVRVNIALPTITSTPYGYAVYAKAAGRTQIRLTDNNVSGATFTLTGAGATSNLSSGVTAAINQLADGWYRCFITVAAASVNGRLALNLVSSDNITYTGDGNSGVYIYGAQLSDSASLDPYVPTPGAAPSSTAFYGPRFDFDPVTLLPRGLLVEEQRTNFIIYSDDFGNAAWTKSDNTVTTNTVVSPDGSTNADTATPTGATPIVRQTYTTSTTGAYTGTIWLRSASNTNATISLRPTGAGSPVSVVCAVTPTWQRFTVNLTAAAGITNIQFWVEQFSQAVNLYGAQLEAGAFATSYIPTVASTVTRSADVATITGQNFAQWYRQDEGTIVGDISLNNAPAAATFSLYAVSDNTANERIFVGTGVGSGGNINTLVTDGGVLQAQTVNGGLSTAGIYRYANAYKLNDFASVANGGAAVTDTSGTVPTVDRLYAGASALGTAQINGHIRNIRFIPARAADFQLQGLTT